MYTYYYAIIITHSASQLKTENIVPNIQDYY